MQLLFCSIVFVRKNLPSKCGPILAGRKNEEKRYRHDAKEGEKRCTGKYSRLWREADIATMEINRHSDYGENRHSDYKETQTYIVIIERHRHRDYREKQT